MTANIRPNIPAKIAAQYIDIWNESNPARRRALIEQVFTPQASYLDPLMQATGHDGLDAMIGAAQAQFAGLRFYASGKPDGHYDIIRFSWALGTSDSESLAEGTDIAVLAADGRIERITGFIDKMPS